MPITVHHGLTATTPDNTQYEIRPSHWNDTHAVSLNLSGSDISAAFSNAGNVTFGLDSNGFLTATANAAGAGDGFNRVSAGSQLAGTNNTIVFSNSNGISFGLSNSSILTASHNGLTSQSVQTQNAVSIQGSTGNISFSNANGITFGVNGSTITASHDALTAQSGQAFSAQGGSSAFQTLNFSNANGATFSNSAGQVQLSYTVPSTVGLISALNVLASNGSNNLTALAFSNSNGLSFGLNGSTITGSYSVPGATIFANGNNVTFGLNGSTITASATFSQTAQSMGVYAVSNTTGGASSGTVDARSLSFQGAGVASVGITNGSVVISVPSGGGAGDGGIGLSAGAASVSSGNVVFSNSNGVSFGLNGSTVTASHNGLTTAAQSNHSHGNPTLALTNLSGTTASASNGLTISLSAAAGGGGADGGVFLSAAGSSQSAGAMVFSNSNGVSFGMAGSTVTASHNALTTQTAQTQSNVAGLYDGANSISTGTARFSNANGVSFGINGQTITASHNGLTTARASTDAVGLATAQSNVTWTVNSAGLSLDARGYAGTATTFNGTNVSGSMTLNSAGLRVDLSAAAGGGGGAAISAAGSSQNAGTVVFSNANGVSFGMNGSTVTASHNGLTTAAASNHSHGNPTLALTNLSGTTASASNGLTLSLSAPAQTVQSIGVYGLGNTTGASSSSSYDARSLSFVGGGIISVGQSNGSVQISAPAAVDFTQLSVGVSTGGNTAGDTGLFTGQVVFAGGNNVTLSGSSNGNSATLSIVGAAGGGGMGISAGTQSVSTGTMVFSNSNGVSFGMSGSSRITASFSQSVQTQSLIAAVYDGANSISTGTVRFSNSNGISFGVNGQTITGSHNGLTTARASNDAIGLATAASNVTWTVNSGGLSLDARGYAGTATTFNGTNASASITLNSAGLRLDLSAAAGGGGGGVGISAAGSSQSAGNIVFSNSNGISFGMNGSTITATVTPGAAAGVGAMNNSNATYTSGTVQLTEGGGAITIASATGQRFAFSVPALSSLVATNGLSVSANGSTLSIGEQPISRLVYPNEYYPLAASAPGQNSVSFNYISVEKPVSASRFMAMLSLVANTHTSASTNTWGMTLEAGLYTRSGSTISQASSGSQSYSGTYSTNSTASLGGLRMISLPMNALMTPGEYWVGLRLSTSSSNASVGLSLYELSNQQTALLAPGTIGAATATSQLLYPMHGIYSVSSASLPVSATLNQVLGSGTQGSRANFYFNLDNYSVIL